jgi:acetoacetyl-CoA synthetase
MKRFCQRILGDAASFADLHRFSIDNPGAFWRAVWEFCNVAAPSGETDVIPANSILEWEWFPDSRLNFAEELLKPSRLSDPSFAHSIAIVGCNEQGERIGLTRKELFDRVMQMASYFSSRSIGVGDRVVAVMPNTIEAVIGMLATATLGAIWSSCSPEFGDDAICDRFGQISPRLLVTTLSTHYNGKTIDLLDKLSRVALRLTTVESVLLVGTRPNAAVDISVLPNAVMWDDAQNTSLSKVAFERFPFLHPLYILYSSGTTGVPKCIMHGAGGTLLQHLKEHVLHCDIKPGDRLFYYTTTGWMMWNWLVSGLASEATIVLYDGSPLMPSADVLWEVAESERITHFGASPRYFASLDKQSCEPNQNFSLNDLRCILSTGSPLLADSFEWVYEHIKNDVALASISGGTDIISCFVLGNPLDPVHAGLIQCKGLGMDVHVYDEQGAAIIGKPGELVCAQAFPSMPIGFWNDPEKAKYRSAYFSRYENVWCHGDWAQETDDGSFIIFGRSDATLNPSGVRIGTAELYQQVEAFPEIAECLATVLRHDGDEQIVLFVKMASGQVLDEQLVSSIRQRLRQRCSARHVPAYIVAAPDIPRTISGKISELAVRSAISNQNLGNAGALANPECMAFYREWKPPRSES